MKLNRTILAAVVAFLLGVIPLGGVALATTGAADPGPASQVAAQLDNTNTNTNLGYLFAIYIITWAGFFAYIFIVSRRQRSLEREIHRLEGLLQQRIENTEKG